MGMQLQHVVADDVTGKLSVKVFCHATSEAAIVTSETEYPRIQSGESELVPVGFPADCVFEYDGRLGRKLKRFQPATICPCITLRFAQYRHRPMRPWLRWWVLRWQNGNRDWRRGMRQEIKIIGSDRSQPIASGNDI